MANTIDDVYGSRVGVDFAQKIAESLLQGKQNYTPNAEMMKLPYSSLLGIKDIIHAISGSQYRDIAGSQDRVQADRLVAPGTVNKTDRLGSRIEQPKVTNARRHDYSGGNPDATGAANAQADVASSVGDGNSFLSRVRQVESGGNDFLVNKYGYRGPYQFSSALEKKYGIDESNWKDRNVQDGAAKQYFADTHKEFTNNLGREPRPGEWYFAHQQGVGGAINHLKNPDLPAWVNMFNTGEGRQKAQARGEAYAIDWAKRAIMDNLPNDSPLKGKGVDNISSGEFSNFWVNRFENPNSKKSTNLAGQPDLSGRMNLGGPQVEGENQPTNQPLGEQHAQAFPSGQTPKGVPPAGPVQNDEQLKAMLRGLPPEHRLEAMKLYFETRKGKEYQGSGTETTVTPNPYGEAGVTTRSKDIKTIDLGHMKIPYSVEPDGKVKLMMPNGQNINSIEDLNKLSAELDTQRKSIETIGSSQTEPITEAIARANTANERGQTLRTMEGIAKSSDDISMGPTSPVFNELKRLIANFTGHTKGIAEADTIEKLSSILASESTKAVSANRGTNFELQTFTRANPNLLQSKGGMLMMIDILKQEIDQQAKLGKIANSYRGKDPASWKDRKEEFYRDNPITAKMPMPDGSTRNFTTKRIDDPKDLDDVPVGTYFITPNGKLGVKK